ncbi:MAG: PilZ domain-containing protein [Planctomycetota bacterium]|jgi:anti-anti-sigma regulatory factor
MGHDQSDDIFITTLSGEPKTSEELNALAAKLALDRPKTDLIMDLGAVGEPSYQTLCKLMTLCSFLSDLGCSCIFYNLSAATRRVFHLYGFDRIFQITEVSEIVFTPSPKQLDNGTLEIRGLNNAKPIERRKYVRLRIPSWLQVNVLFWHGGRNDDYHKLIPGHFWHGRLVDISEGGIQVAIDAAERTHLDKGQLIGLEFRPIPAEPLLIFDTKIREVLPTADGKNICLGLQFIGLEANPEGRQGLRKLCVK